MSEAWTSALKPGDRIGAARCIRPIARGGMGDVYLASIPSRWWGRRLVAVKCVGTKTAAQPEFAATFRREARIGQRLRHPNIVAVVGHDVGPEQPHLLLEYVHGPPLAKLIKRAAAKKSALPRGVALGIVAAVADALHHAHERRRPDGSALGIVHRDVTPSNVLLSVDGHVKLADFGVARISEVTKTTRASLLKGRVGYMSPEQLLGSPVDRRADVFALGVVLYEASTGYRAFAGRNPYETTNRILEGRYTPPQALVHGYPDRMAELVAACLDPDPDARPATAGEVSDRIAAVATALGVDTGRRARRRYIRRELGLRSRPWRPLAAASVAAVLGVAAWGATRSTTPALVDGSSRVATTPKRTAETPVPERAPARPAVNPGVVTPPTASTVQPKRAPAVTPPIPVSAEAAVVERADEPAPARRKRRTARPVPDARPPQPPPPPPVDEPSPAHAIPPPAPVPPPIAQSRLLPPSMRAGATESREKSTGRAPAP